MRARTSFVMAVVAWPMPMLAVGALASGRPAVAAAAWAGFVGIGGWAVGRLVLPSSRPWARKRVAGTATARASTVPLRASRVPLARALGDRLAGAGAAMAAGAADGVVLASGHRDGLVLDVHVLAHRSLGDDRAPEPADAAPAAPAAGDTADGDDVDRSGADRPAVGEPGDVVAGDLGDPCGDALGIAAGLARLEAFANGADLGFRQHSRGEPGASTAEE